MSYAKYQTYCDRWIAFLCHRVQDLQTYKLLKIISFLAHPV